MEGPYGNNSSRVSKLKVFNGNVSPINSQRDNHQFFIGGGRLHHPPKSPTLDPYSENLDSALIRYLRSGSPASPVAGDNFKAPVDGAMIGHQFLSGNSSGSGGSVGYLSSWGSSATVSPLSAVENLETPPARSPPVFKTPVKVEEDVLVMDGILVESVAGGRMRLSALSDSGGSSSSSSGSKSFYKTEICRSWEDSSHCRYGSKCQFAHGKEEVRPSRFPTKNKSEAQTCKSYSSSGTCSYGSKCRFAHHQVTTSAISPTGPSVTATILATTQTISLSSIKAENSSESGSKSTSSGKVTVASTDWSPLDDGIEVSLPSSASTNEIPSREAVNAYINSVLYGPSRGKRLPVFAEICPE
ncbi:uncharacterized protein LOC130755182 [Actinidia eriantha]|uniref:uncharacterized protein LOC130755182 n=1 Tax=Actinidia eriantha TaxID=165200 RepID=UPI0025840D24|nr:uncharacterized protein LOC130755182 [Actinidia eriantha]